MEAAQWFERARAVDPANLSGMDRYALIVKQQGENLALNRLAHELLNIDPNRPEAREGRSAGSVALAPVGGWAWAVPGEGAREALCGVTRPALSP